MKPFSYHNPVKIHFGVHSLNNLNNFVQNKKALLITTNIFNSLGIVSKLKSLAPSIVHTIDTINILPTFELLGEVYNEAWSHQWDVIIGLGSGSVLDTAKILSVYDDSKKFSFVEKLIRGQTEKTGYKTLPVIAIPTTAGTGSDVTPWATAWDMQEKKKYSLHLDDLWCQTTICDPMLTFSLPKNLTIHAALDALSHSLESIWNKNANPISTHHAIYAAKTIITYLPQLTDDLSNLEYRTELMRAALHAGLAFSNTQTAIAHAMSYYFTANKNIPHGIACSFTLPDIVDSIIGQDKRIDNNLIQIFGELSSRKLRAFFKKLQISTKYSHYQLSTNDIRIIQSTVANNQRAQNSLVDNKKLFSILMEEKISETTRQV